MSSFRGRTQTASELEAPFIHTLNQECETHEIAKFGAESTGVSEIHKYIRFATDISSRFVRFLPDSVMVRKGDGIGPKTALVEFKVQDTLIYSDNFLRSIQKEYQEKKQPEDPELTEKPQIFNVEKDALYIYNEIATKLGVVVVVIGWQKPTNRFIAQYADKIVICNQWHGDPQRRTSGSGTPNCNTHIDSYEPLGAFFTTEFGIQDHVLNAIMQSIRRQS
ncbi:hypothetical protein F4Z99_20245 [Candidatus Poribacteria bacterium]|nr:hypothetical protein [Candidatus Poribacteria bacterium]MYA99329.1 hypothetical protein [Candidatus Poribacteria bacterium]